MRTLRLKLLRDLVALKGQVAAIAVVIAAGVMTLVIAVTTLDAISLSKERFYDDYRFADLFVDLTRAPERLEARLLDIPGVSQAETRIRAPVRLSVEGFADPIQGALLSIPDGRQPGLNRLHLREGSLPESGRSDQVVISEPFAEAHGLKPGDRIEGIIDGRLERLTVSGVALSPEFVYQIGPDDLLPDYERFGVLWMNRSALAGAFDMDGAFNSAVIRLQRGASQAPVLDELEYLLERYGGIGGHGRDEQLSHRFLSEEIDQLRVMATVLPAIFLGVSAFLLNVLMARIIATQRQQVAVLKAFGYANREIGLYYASLTGLIVLIGSAVGVLFGAWAADALAGVYMEYFRFPEMSFRVQPGVVVLGLLVAGGAAGLGTFRAVFQAVRLPPAEAMRPPMPERFRQSAFERLGVMRHLRQPSRIIVRSLARHRLKSAFSVLGIALSCSLLVVGSYQFNAVDHMIDTQYRLVQKSDIHLHLSEPTAESALGELLHHNGVNFAEGFRSVSIRLSRGHNEYRTSLLGMDAQPKLRGLIDREHRDQRLPDEGLVLTDYLAEYLGVKVGETVEAEVMSGKRQSLSVPVAGTVAEPLGVGAYMERRALNRLLGEGPAINGAWLLIDKDHSDTLFAQLRDLPGVAGIGMMGDAEDRIREYIEDTVLVMMSVLLVLAGSIAFAVVYNNARIAFAERSRELATLRVLGFTRSEVAWILVGEMAVLTLAAIPLGWLLGTGMSLLLNEAMTMDMFRVPFVITHQTYAFAAAGVIVAAALSLLLIGRRLYRLDMISALKTAE